MTDGLDPEVALAISYAPVDRRDALLALFALDARLGEIANSGRDAMVRQLRLAWWRDALIRLDTALPPAEPLLQSLAARVVHAGVDGAALAGLAELWETLLDGGDGNLIAIGARGALLFGLAGRLLGGAVDQAVTAAGEAWALAHYARRASSPEVVEQALALARTTLAGREQGRWQRSLRPLGAQAVLAARDARRGTAPLEPVGAPARVARMLLMRLTGY